MVCRSGAVRLLMRRHWLLVPCVALGLAQSIAAATLGPPVLESGLGEQLRIVMPVVSSGRDRLAADCVKLRSSASEANDISASVRADVVTIGDRQAVVLTTARPVNELVISVAVAIECDTWFTRRYTFLLDLPTGNHAVPQPLAAPVAVEPSSLPSVATDAPKAASPKQRSSRAAPRAAGVATTPRAIRPEEEPGVLPRQTRSAGKKSVPPMTPMAPPVRSMLKIELGGLDEFLASQPRSPLEEQTGMRLATGLSENDRTKPVATGEPGFRLAHARYLAAMRDTPDPVSLENAALGKRIDAFSKDLASLKVDLQTTRARADELEASRVSWWWLLVVALGAGGLAFGAALLLLRRSTAAGPLIVVDPPRKSDLSAHPAQGQHNRATTAQPTSVGQAGTASTETAAETDFSLPELAGDGEEVAQSQTIPVPPPVSQVVATYPKPDFQATLKLDKNSLTQQLTTMTDLSDEAWASYRHSSDTSGVAVPFGSGPAPKPAGPAAAAVPVPIASKPDRRELPAMDFQLDLDEKPEVPATAGSAAPAAGDAIGAGVAARSDAAGEAAQADLSHQSTSAPFLLDTLDLPAGLANPPDMLAPLSVEKSAPNAMQSIEMHVVMASASSVMENVHKLMEQDQPSAALRALGGYLESAPATAPPGPWIMLAHALHQVGMRREYVESQALFKARFGVDLPDWEAAYDLKRQQLGLARMPGIEIMVAAERGKPELIGRLAGVAYRLEVAPEVLFDLAFHREILQLAAACRPGFSFGQGDVDLAL